MRIRNGDRVVATLDRFIAFTIASYQTKRHKIKAGHEGTVVYQLVSRGQILYWVKWDGYANNEPVVEGNDEVKVL